MSVAPFTKVGSQLLVDGAMYTETGGVVLADTGAPCAVTVGPVVAPFDEAEYFATQVRAVLRKYGANAHVWMPGPGVPVLGPELVVNGDFATDTWWSKEAGWTISGGAAVATAAADGMYVYRPSLVEAGKTYLVTYTCTEYTSGSFRCNIGGTWGTMRSSAGTFSEVLVATNSAFTYNGIRATGGNTTAKFDNVSVKEITGYSTLLNGFQAANYLEANASGAPQVVDQPVGYVGDAANVTLGPELAINGDFSNGTTGWFATDATASVVDGQLSINASLTTGRVEQSLTVTANKVYKLSARMSAGTATSVRIEAIRGTAGSYGMLGASENVTTVGKDVSLVFFATGSDIILKARTNSVTGTFALDNVSLKEITGAIPATQATTANKPILRRGHVNRIRNSTMQGAVVGTPGTLPTNWAVNVSAGLSTHVVANGVEDGLDYIDLRIFGTASGSTWNMHFDSVTAIDTVVGTNWTAAVNVRMVGGSAAGITAIGTCPRFGQSAGTVTNATPALVALTSSHSRLTRTDTGAANTAKITQRLDMNITNGAAIDVTIRIAAPQLETGSVANSYVPTTTAAASSNTGGYWWEFGMEATPNDQIKLTAAPFTWQDDHAVVTAFFHQRSTGSCIIFGGTSDAASARLCQMYTNNGLTQISWVPDTGGALVASGSVMGIGEARVMSGVRRGADGILRENAVVKQTIPVGGLTAATIDTWALGAHKSTVANPLSGGIFATIAIKGTVSDADLKILEKWVGQQAGVQIA